MIDDARVLCIPLCFGLRSAPCLGVLPLGIYSSVQDRSPQLGCQRNTARQGGRGERAAENLPISVFAAFSAAVLHAV